MADKNFSGAPPPTQNGRIEPMTSKCSPPLHHNGSLETGLGCSPSNTSAVPHSAASSRNSVSTSPLRTLRTLGDLVTPGPGPGPEESSIRPRGQSLGSALSSRTRAMTSRSKHRSGQQEEPDALLDLILECQGQRLEDQRASLSLLPDPGPAALCGACSSDQPSPPTLDFYYMLIHYQSDRMDDQRCSLPDLDDVLHSAPEGQEDFFTLIQRAQSRRMDEQRASLQTHTAGSSHHCHHH
uniref:G-protein-signaling modulator 1 n=1 Tax=Scatophagus argus TaxID=75038 RepID=UPI001ED8423B|nr:G-protein-signaling modulator 1 [Scatophagus argus]